MTKISKKSYESAQNILWWEKDEKREGEYTNGY